MYGQMVVSARNGVEDVDAFLAGEPTRSEVEEDDRRLAVLVDAGGEMA